MTVDRLTPWLRAAGITVSGAACLELIAGGRSNLTYRVTGDAEHDGGEQVYVLRRPPHGDVLASAHDMGREFRIISALAATDVPVPPALSLCADENVLGAPFYVMGLVPGVVLARHEDGLHYSPAARPVASRAVADALVAIHAVDIDAVGLGSLGRREDYCARQLRRWQRQFHDSAVRPLPVVDEVHDRLVASMPPQRHTGLVHGDYRLGNVLLDDAGHVQAVLDWELATLGDTLADVGYLAATWRRPGEDELLATPTAAPGFLDRDDVVARYAETSGRDVSDLGWYQAFALWRLTCISEGVYARYLAGSMGDDGMDVEVQGRRVLRIAEAAHAALAGVG